MNKSLFAKPICVQRLARVPQKGLSPLCVKQFITFLIALAAMTVSTTSAWAQTESIKYLDYDRYPYYNTFSEASHDDPTKITSSSISLSGWYYVEGNVTISSTVTLSGDTYLILCDDAELKINVSDGKGIYGPGNYMLTIYAQSSGSRAGKLSIESSEIGIEDWGNITINGGNISVTSTSGGHGIQCNWFTVNGGKVGIVAPINHGISAPRVTINGGTVSATGKYGIYSSDDSYYIYITGGQVTATGDRDGISFKGGIKLEWTKASDYIKASSYDAVNVRPSKSFNIEGGGTLAAGTTLTNDQKIAIKDKKLTPNTTTPIYTVSLGTVTGGTVEVDRTKAFEDERVAINVTPEAGNILASLTYTDGTDTYTIGTNSTDIKRQANDYVITMPAANVTVNATFATPVAQIGDTKYATLAEALAAVSDGETITIISDKDESSTNYNFSTHGSTRNVTINMNGCTYSFGNISNKYGDLNIIGPGTFNFGSFSNQGEFLFKDVTVNCNFIDNPGGSANITFDNAKAVCNSGIVGNSSLQLYGADQGIVLKNGSDVEIRQGMYVGYNDNFTLDIQDAASILKLRSCAISSMNKSYVEDQFLQYIRPDQKTVFSSDLANGNAITLDLRASWGIMLASDLGEISPGVPKATVTFYDGGTSFDPTAFTPSTYTTSTTFIDNSDGNDHYVIAHIVPAAGYWTDLSLLSAVETGASLTGAANTITMRERDQYNAAFSGDSDMRDRYDGAGWYYYTLPKGHSVAAGYTTSTIGGDVVRHFDFSDNDAKATIAQDFDNNTVTVGRTDDDWTAVLTYDKFVWPFSVPLGSLPHVQSISIQKGSTELIRLTDAAVIDIQVNPDYAGGMPCIGYNNLKPHSGEYGWFVGSDDRYIGQTRFIIEPPFQPVDPTQAKNTWGSPDNPWAIASTADLNMLAKCVNYGGWAAPMQYFEQTGNIAYDAAANADFEPIGADQYCESFQGHYNGKDFTISGIDYTCTRPKDSDNTEAYVGLFGSVSCMGDMTSSVKNVTLIDCKFRATSESCAALVGSVVASATGAGSKKLSITGCKVLATSDGSALVSSLSSDNCATGAIIGAFASSVCKLENNYYGYGVKVTNTSGTASGYTKRGTGIPDTYNSGTGLWTFVLDDIPIDDGAMLWVKKATLTGGTSANGSTVAFNKVTKGTDRYDMAGDDFYYAVGQTVTLDVNLGNRTDGVRTFWDELTALTMNDGTADTDIKDALSFTMPGADASVTATIAESDWFTINTVNYNAADPTAPFAYNWMTFYHEWTMKDPTSGNNVAGKFVVTNYDDPTAAVEVKTITAVDPTAGTYTSAAINGSYSGVPTLFHYADNNNGVLPQKLKFTPDFNIEQNQKADRHFKGTATALALSASAKCYILNNAGDFILAYITPTDNTIAAHRCYVDLSGDNSNQARLISSSDATGIDSMVNGQGTMDNLDGDWFSLDGRRLNGQPTRKGIYIHHGKKTVIK